MKSYNKIKTSKHWFGCLCAAVLSLFTISTAHAQIFVANTNSGTVNEYNLDGTPVGTGVLISGLSGVGGLALFGSNLLVASANGGGTIGEYTTSGATVNASLITGLSSPSALALSGSNLFVANSGSNTIGEYTLGATLGTVTSSTPSLISGLSSPTGVAVSGSNLFVVNDSNGTVGEYTTSGATVNASLITGLQSALKDVVSGSNLYVLSFGDGSGSVGEYTLGATLGTVTSSTPSLISGLGNPRGLALFGSDLFVANDYSGTIAKYTTSGASVSPSLITGLNVPEDILVVPEPSTWAMLLGGLGLLAVWRLRMRRTLV